MGRTTTSLCPECFETVEGEYVERDGRVVLERTCPDHGPIAPEVWRDPDHLAWTNGFPPDETGSGLDVVQRHVCLAVLEVTSRCNLTCDYCFASSGPVGDDLTLEEARRRLDVAAQDDPCPLQISGGEPTVHPKLPEIVEAARERGFDHVEVNTNGLRLATDGYARKLKDAGVTAIYLQLDSLRSEPNAKLRGRDLLDQKREAIDRCREADLPVVVACTVVGGLNDDRLGELLDYALENRPPVRAVNFQTVARFGRYGPGERLPLDAVARRLADQVPFLETRDFLPVPCCSPRCQMATVLVPGADRPVPVTRFVDDDTWADLGPGIDERGWMEVLAGTDRGRDPEFLEACCGLEVPAGARDRLDDAFPVGLVGFMDAERADLDTLQNCCIAVPTEDGLAPFCAYQMTDADGRYRFRDEQGWPGRRRAT